MRFHRIAALGAAIVLALAATTGVALAAAKAKAVPAGKVNINTATVEQIASLPGVGGKMAARIVEYRQKAGGFKSVQELMNVKGIGEKNLQRLAGSVTTGDAPARSATK
jgi:competence protein ComEA